MHRAVARLLAEVDLTIRPKDTEVALFVNGLGAVLLCYRFSHKNPKTIALVRTGAIERLASALVRATNVTPVVDGAKVSAPSLWPHISSDESSTMRCGPTPWNAMSCNALPCHALPRWPKPGVGMGWTADRRWCARLLPRG